MVTGVRTYRDNEKGAARGMSTAYVCELDGLYIAHLGEVGHLLDQDTVREIGHVDIVCLGIGPQLSAAHAAEVVGQLDAHMVVPMPLTEAAATATGAAQAKAAEAEVLTDVVAGHRAERASRIITKCEVCTVG